jgi:hypothetical protein
MKTLRSFLLILVAAVILTVDSNAGCFAAPFMVLFLASSIDMGIGGCLVKGVMLALMLGLFAVGDQVEAVRWPAFCFGGFLATQVTVMNVR